MSTIESKCVQCGHSFLVNFPDRAEVGTLDVDRLIQAADTVAHPAGVPPLSDEWWRVVALWSSDRHESVASRSSRSVGRPPG